MSLIVTLNRLVVGLHDRPLVVSLTTGALDVRDVVNDDQRVKLLVQRLEYCARTFPSECVMGQRMEISQRDQAGVPNKPVAVCVVENRLAAVLLKIPYGLAVWARIGHHRAEVGHYRSCIEDHGSGEDSNHHPGVPAHLPEFYDAQRYQWHKQKKRQVPIV